MSADVFKSFTGASATGQVRPQTVLTPPCVVERLERFWPDGIDLDPCSCEGSLVKAKLCWDGTAESGLTGHWFLVAGSVYVNQPFNELHAWLAKCKAEADAGCEIVQLGPWRSRRKWFRAAYKDADAVMLLDPLVFYDSLTGQPWRSKSGQVTQFPENLALLYWGERRREFFTEFCALGDPL